LFKRMGATTLIPVLKKSPYLDAHIYYVFETEENGKLFDVAMWGIYGGVYVNGVEVNDNAIFYDAIMPFLPDDIDKWIPG